MADPAQPDEQSRPAQASQAKAVLDDPFAPLLANMYDAALHTKGQLSAELRQAAARNQGLPPVLAPVVDKIARHAYRVTDEDIQGLKQAGYSEDQIYELIVAAAVGRACSMAEKALAALHGSVAQNRP